MCAFRSSRSICRTRYDSNNDRYGRKRLQNTASCPCVHSGLTATYLGPSVLDRQTRRGAGDVRVCACLGNSHTLLPAIKPNHLCKRGTTSPRVRRGDLLPTKTPPPASVTTPSFEGLHGEEYFNTSSSTYRYCQRECLQNTAQRCPPAVTDGNRWQVPASCMLAALLSMQADMKLLSLPL
jgi:hypothetical protein